MTITRAEEVFNKVEALVAGGTERSAAFKEVAQQLGIATNSARGSYYSWSRKQNADSGVPSRPRRRETTAADALASARQALERAIVNIDREVEAAKVRVDEAQAEYEALKGSATERKAEISTRLEALK